MRELGIPALNLRIFELTRQNQSGVNRSAKYVTAIVVAHLLVNIAHGLAHRELRVGLDPPASIFVTVVVLVSPLLAMALVWTTKKRIGLILLSLSMFGSLLFGFYHHFLVASPDHIHSQPSGGWGTTFVLTAYLLLITEAIGTYVGVHFLSNMDPLRRPQVHFEVAVATAGVVSLARGIGICPQHRVCYTGCDVIRRSGIEGNGSVNVEAPRQFIKCVTGDPMPHIVGQRTPVGIQVVVIRWCFREFVRARPRITKQER